MAMELKRGNKVTLKGELFLASNPQNSIAFRMLCKTLGAHAIFSKPIAKETDIDFIKDDAPIIALIGSKKLVSKLDKHPSVAGLAIDTSKFGDGEISEIIEKTKKPIILIVDGHSAIPGIESSEVSAILLKFENKDKTEAPIDYKLVTKVKDLVNLPLIVSAKLDSPEDLHSTIKKTAADAVALGDIALGQPVIFEQAINYFEKGYYNKITRKRREKTVASFEEIIAEYDPSFNSAEKSRLISKFMEE